LYTPQIEQEETKEEKITEVPEMFMRYEERTEQQNKISPGGFLNKPANVYAQSPVPTEPVKPVIAIEAKQEEIKKEEPKPLFEEEAMELELVIKEDVNEKQPSAPAIHNLPMNDEEEEQKRRADERIHKLRNLSYNMSSMDTNNEYENVPAYVRRNLELFGNSKLTSVEDFYSKVSVKKDENNQTQISTINTFLDGKKPD
jgi:cell division protein FtsZ